MTWDRLCRSLPAPTPCGVWWASVVAAFVAGALIF